MTTAQTQDDLAALLQAADVRPTRQRLAIAAWLFNGVHKHVTAEAVHAGAPSRVSLATVYNTLHHFTEAGLLHQVIIDGGQVYFDTNTGSHQHIFDETTGHLSDIPADSVRLAALPELPRGKQLARVDIVLRVRSGKGK